MQLTFWDIVIVLVTNIIAFSLISLNSYFKKKGENAAIIEDIGEIKKITEDIKHHYDKDLSEYNVRLEKFKKVQEIRIDIFERMTKFKLMVLEFADLEKFKPNELPIQYELDKKISAEQDSIVRDLLAHKIFLNDCLDEIDELEENVRGWWMQKDHGMLAAMVVCNSMDNLMKKMMDYKTVE